MAILQVGMADLKIATVPDMLSSTGLGSCIGICIWDKQKKIAALVHIMLPDSTQTKSLTNRTKFADTGVLEAVERLYKAGASTVGLVAKIAGGAQMFKVSSESDVLKVGERNSAAVIANLKKNHIRLLAHDVGGNFGRTIIFNIETGELQIKTIGHGEKII
jgi:chemotaxis protein CheD